MAVWFYKNKFSPEQLTIYVHPSIKDNKLVISMQKPESDSWTVSVTPLSGFILPDGSASDDFFDVLTSIGINLADKLSAGKLMEKVGDSIKSGVDKGLEDFSLPDKDIEIGDKLDYKCEIAGVPLLLKPRVETIEAFSGRFMVSGEIDISVRGGE